MAAAYPAARFEGFDPSRHAVDRARAKIAEAGEKEHLQSPLPGHGHHRIFCRTAAHWNQRRIWPIIPMHAQALRSAQGPGDAW